MANLTEGKRKSKTERARAGSPRVCSHQLRQIRQVVPLRYFAAPDSRVRRAITQIA
jgi:hypothetical protein